jgi:hypothetical protein
MPHMVGDQHIWAPAKPADMTDFDEEAAHAFMADAVRLLGAAPA